MFSKAVFNKYVGKCHDGLYLNMNVGNRERQKTQLRALEAHSLTARHNTLPHLSHRSTE